MKKLLLIMLVAMTTTAQGQEIGQNELRAKIEIEKTHYLINQGQVFGGTNFYYRFKEYNREENKDKFIDIEYNKAGKVVKISKEEMMGGSFGIMLFDDLIILYTKIYGERTSGRDNWSKFSSNGLEYRIGFSESVFHGAGSGVYILETSTKLK